MSGLRRRGVKRKILTGRTLTRRPVMPGMVGIGGKEANGLIGEKGEVTSLGIGSRRRGGDNIGRNINFF